MMTSAEFRCHREALGISVEWLAWHMEVTPRSVHRWEADETHPIPEWFSRKLLELVDATDRYVAARKREAETVGVLGTYRGSVDIPRVDGERVIFPAAWHRAATLRAARHREAMIYYRDAIREDSTIDDAARGVITEGGVAH